MHISIGSRSETHWFDGIRNNIAFAEGIISMWITERILHLILKWSFSSDVFTRDFVNLWQHLHFPLHMCWQQMLWAYSSFACIFEKSLLFHFYCDFGEWEQVQDLGKRNVSLQLKQYCFIYTRKGEEVNIALLCFEENITDLKLN